MVDTTAVDTDTDTADISARGPPMPKPPLMPGMATTATPDTTVMAVDTTVWDTPAVIYGYGGYYGHPYRYGGYRYFGKRSADAEPEADADASADAWYGYYGYGHRGYYGYGGYPYS